MTVKVGTTVVDLVPASGPVRLWDCGTEWARLQPAPNVFVWDRLDALLAQLPGRRVMLVLGHPAAWAAKGGPDGKQAQWLPPGANRPPANLDLWREYVTAVATRYAGRITEYQIWNEPVDDAFYSGTFKELAVLVTAARGVIRSIDPAARIVSPPLQPRRQAKWRTKGLQLTRALRNAGEPFDVWAAHIYPQQGEGLPAWQRDIRKVTKRTRLSKPLWVTETNFNLLGPGNPYPTTKQQTLNRGVTRIADAENVDCVYWYAYAYPNPAAIGVTNFNL